MERDVPVLFYREGDAWVGQAIGVEVSSFGPTFDEARHSVQEALELYFEDGDSSQVADVKIETLHVKAV